MGEICKLCIRPAADGHECDPVELRCRIRLLLLDLEDWATDRAELLALRKQHDEDAAEISALRDEVIDLHIVAQSIKHYWQCNPAAGIPCVRCQRDAERARAEKAEAALVSLRARVTEYLSAFDAANKEDPLGEDRGAAWCAAAKLTDAALARLRAEVERE